MRWVKVDLIIIVCILFGLMIEDSGFRWILVKWLKWLKLEFKVGIIMDSGLLSILFFLVLMEDFFIFSCINFIFFFEWVLFYCLEFYDRLGILKIF